MRKLLSSWRKQGDDSGDSVLVTVVLAMPLLILLMSFAVGISHSIETKALYNNINQDSVHSAVRKVDANGQLSRESMLHYLEVAHRSIALANPAKSDACHTVEVDGRTWESPYIEVRLFRERGFGDSTYNPNMMVSSGGRLIRMPSFSYYPQGKVIESKMYVAAPVALPLFGMDRCHQYEVFASAAVFGDKVDDR